MLQNGSAHGSLQGSTAQGVAPGRCGAVRTWAWPTPARCADPRIPQRRGKEWRAATRHVKARARDGASARRTGTTRGVRPIPIRRCAIAPTERGDTEPPPHPRSLELPRGLCRLANPRTPRDGNLTTAPNRGPDPPWLAPQPCAYILALRVAMAELQGRRWVV